MTSLIMSSLTHPSARIIFYADCNLIWEAWLTKGLRIRVRKLCSPQTPPTQHLADYATPDDRLRFGEMYRVLKPGRWASVVFHNRMTASGKRFWSLRAGSGFEMADDQRVRQGTDLHSRGSVGKKGLQRVTNKDIVLNLRKPKPGDTQRPTASPTRTRPRGAIVEAIAEFLETDPDPSDRTLQAPAEPRPLQHAAANGSRAARWREVGEMLPHYFKEVDGRWYLRGEAVVGGNAFDLKTDADAIAWLTQVLSDEPQTTGELIPRWQAETAYLAGSDAGRLDRLLEQNFWLDQRTGRWRVPTAAEREQDVEPPVAGRRSPSARRPPLPGGRPGSPAQRLGAVGVAALLLPPRGLRRSRRALPAHPPG